MSWMSDKIMTEVNYYDQRQRVIYNKLSRRVGAMETDEIELVKMWAKTLQILDVVSVRAERILDKKI